MRNIGRLILAVLAGAAVWAALWIGGTQLSQIAFPDIATPDQPLTHTGLLVGYIAYSTFLSLLAGFVTALAAGAQRPMVAVTVLAFLQLALGIIAEASYWSLLPVWYHLVFLALIVPATLYGGTLRSGASHRVAVAA